MSEHFHVFGGAVRRRFEEMSRGELYEVDATDLWSSYLAAFPEGSDPIFRVRSEHDCSCCRAFVRGVGNVVALDEDGNYRTVWDVGMTELPFPYDDVSKRMSDLVRQLPIKGVFRTKQPSYGSEITREYLEDQGATRTWNHFSAKIDSKHLTPNPEEMAGRLNTGAQVMERQLRELSQDAVRTVLGLIGDNQLYRGQEFLHSVQEFQRLKTGYDALQTPSAKSAFAWRHAQSNGTAFRNSVIGGLVVALSEGEELESAVRKFEAQVAPQNYKRPKALVTQRMVDDALHTIRTLDMEPALERRHAKLSDVSIKDVLWVNNLVRGNMKGGLEGLLSSSVVVPPRAGSKDVRSISIDDFTSEVVPKLSSLDVVLEGRHERNLFSLTAPVHTDAKPLFRWPGDLGWSYNGDVTDSVRERVKRAGGNVDAPLRVSLSWYNTDDLDLHCVCPDGHVFYGDKRSVLDVDMNNGFSTPKLVRDAVENLSWVNPRDGQYAVFVNQYRRRETVDVGFELEFHHPDGTQSFSCSNMQSDGSNVNCITFRIARGRVTELFVHDTVKEGAGKQSEFWGVKTGVPTAVKTLMLSPNFAETGVGSKHWFFALENCLNPDPVRGIYNEFLRPELLEHKRVFELLGAKSKAEYSPYQVSGVGFTRGRDDSVTVDVRGDGVGGLFEVKF